MYNLNDVFDTKKSISKIAINEDPFVKSLAYSKFLEFKKIKVKIRVNNKNQIDNLFFGKEKITSGAAGDISSVTYWAKKMITEWGMSETLGKIRYNNDSEEIFLGH